MRTSKPISTISYNSKEYLIEILNKLVNRNVIAFWCAIKHIGETLDDGTVEKDHIHVYIEPNVPIDSMDIQKQTCEYDPSHPNKPLKCIDFRPSKWDDWVWYCLHNELYLRSKVEFRQYTYTKDEFFYSDQDEFEVRYQRAIHSSAIASQFKVQTMLREHSVGELAALGFINPNQAFNFMSYSRLIQEGLEERWRMENEQLAEQKRKERIEGEKKRIEKLDEPIGD